MIKSLWRNRGFRLVLGTAVSILFLYLAVKDVPLALVAEALAHANYVWVLIGAFCIVLQSWLRALRWISLFYPLDKGLRIPRMFGTVLIGQMLNVVMPWRVGDLARVYLASEIEKRSKGQALATLGTEKIFDTLILLLIALAIPFFMILPQELVLWREGFIGLSFALFAGATVLLVAGDKVLDQLRRLPIPALRRVLDEHGQLALGTLDVFTRWDLHLRLQILSLLIALLGVVVNYLVFLGLNLQLPLIAPFLLFVVLQIGGSLPSAPGKVGVFQYLCVWTLALYGVDASIGLANGILLYVVAYGVPVVLGILMLWWGGVSIRTMTTSRVQMESPQ